MPPRRLRHGVIFVLTFAIASTIATFCIIYADRVRNPEWRKEKAKEWTPYRWWTSPDFLYEPYDDMPTNPPRSLKWLSDAPWPGQFPMPDIKSTRLLVKLHIFSMNNDGSKARRQLIREHDMLGAVPEEYKDLVEMKFVIGRCRLRCEDLMAEQEEYGDILMLDMEENMNRGKSVEWLRSVNREGEREALWVFKVDDDTLLYTQNLLDILVTLDPTIPTYIGDPAPDWEHRYLYMQGGLYGFSYGIVRTLEAADIPYWELVADYPEDSRLGRLMTILPSVPDVQRTHHDPHPFPLPPERHRAALSFGQKFLPAYDFTRPRYPPPGRLRRQPTYAGGPLVSQPNQESGLVRVVLRGFFGQRWDRFLYRDHRQVGVHGVKSDEEFIGWWNEHQQKLKAYGREQWKVPRALKEYLAL